MGSVSVSRSKWIQTWTPLPGIRNWEAQGMPSAGWRGELCERHISRPDSRRARSESLWGRSEGRWNLGIRLFQKLLRGHCHVPGSGNNEAAKLGDPEHFENSRRTGTTRNTEAHSSHEKATERCRAYWSGRPGSLWDKAMGEGVDGGTPRPTPTRKLSREARHSGQALQHFLSSSIFQ